MKIKRNWILNVILKIFEEQIDINTIRNKFDALMIVAAGNIDILLITESTQSTLKVSFILMALTYLTELKVTLTVVAFCFMFAMKLDHA